MIVGSLRRTARFLIAVQAGVPIVSSAFLDDKLNVSRSRSLKYNSLFVQNYLFKFSLSEYAEKFKDAELLTLGKSYFKEYNLQFILQFNQRHRLVQNKFSKFVVVAESVL